MPNIKSAIKRVKITRTRTLRNSMLKSALRTSLKKYREAVASKDVSKVKELYPATVKAIDKAVAKNILHKNAAARKKSQIAKMMNLINQNG